MFEWRFSTRPTRPLLLWCLLMSLYEQSSQILQVMVHMFGPMPKHEDGKEHPLDNNHETVRKAAAFMIPLAELYAKGELDRTSLREEKNRLLKSIGSTSRSGKSPMADFEPTGARKSCLKKPAAKEEPANKKETAQKRIPFVDEYNMPTKKARATEATDDGDSNVASDSAASSAAASALEEECAAKQTKKSSQNVFEARGTNVRVSDLGFTC